MVRWSVPVRLRRRKRVLARNARRGWLAVPLLGRECSPSGPGGLQSRPMSLSLINLVERLAGRRVVLLGDLMLDRYIYGNAERLAPEAPVPVLHYHHEESSLGGAGRVAAGITALGGKCVMVGLVGEDMAGREVTRQLQDCQVDTRGVITLGTRPTISKVRMVGMAQHRHPQPMMRLDYEDSAALENGIENRVIDLLDQLLSEADALCIEDYSKGLVSQTVCREAIARARRRGLPVMVDPGPIDDFGRYAGASVLKPNRPETAAATKLPVNTPEQYQAAAEWLLEKLNLDAATITLDREGVYLATRDGRRQWIRSRERKVYDVTGAGDMFLAALTLARASAAPWSEAVTLANVAGGLECEKFGSVPVTPAEMIQELLLESHGHLGKIRTREQLIGELARHRAAGKRVVFTNGCFDLVHVGHVQYFKFARAQGDLLVVGVNTDASIRRLKGPKRPIMAEEDRMGVLEGLESIDYLVMFDEDTPTSLLEAIRPDVLVKGQDYSKDQVVGGELVEAYGGKIALAPLAKGRSTSNVIQRILEAYGEE